MGSGNSKLNPEGEVVPAKLRPLLRRWFDEIRRRKDPNMSKKELLVHDQGVEEDVSSQPLSQHENERKSMTSTSDESVARSSKVEDEKPNVVPVPAESNKTSKDVKEHKDEEKCEKQDEKDGARKEEEKEVKVVEKAVVVEEVLVVVKETAEEEEDDDEEEEEGDEDEKVTFGSPSFRVYCIPSTESYKEESKDESTQRDSGSGESVESNSDEGQEKSPEKNTKKKGNRGRRLKRAIKSGPVAVKNLLNVTSCYHPGCSGNDRARLLAEKAEG